MKKNICLVICLSFLIAFIFSCSKKTFQTNPLVGKWNMVSDTLATLGLSGANFIGTSNDYYNFIDNGTLYIKEGASQFTTMYTLLVNNQVDIVYTLSNAAEVHRTYDITNFTEHTLTLTFVGSSLGPAQYQIINFKK